MGTDSHRPLVAEAYTVVVKLGTRVLTNGGGELALGRLFSLIETIAAHQRTGRRVIVVSSGAVGLGKDELGLKEMPKATVDRQACAALGQTRLMSLYREGLRHYGLSAAQILLTQNDLSDRARYLNVRNTLENLLSHGVVPIINENDAVSTRELELGGGTFGDNDQLSALVASKMAADLLVLLTDVEGVFTQDPHHHPDAPRVAKVDDLDELEVEASGATSAVGRGGMRSKVEAASRAARSGCNAVIASGLDPANLRRVLAGDDVGTWFVPSDGMSARQRWIAFAPSRGTMRLDAGAVDALRGGGDSLLAVGVVAVEGDFDKGEVVELQDGSGSRLGQGVSQVDATTAREWVHNPRPPADQGRSQASGRGRLIRRQELILD